MSNVGRASIKKLAVKFEGNEILSIDDFDILTCYRDLWKTASEKRNAIRQGIISNDGCANNCIKLRINASDKSTGNARDKAIADTYGNKFVIPLDFEMLGRSAPCYQVGLGNRLCYEITFNNYNRVINSSVAAQMLSMKSQISPQNMRLLLNLPLQDLSKLSMTKWCCCRTEFSDIGKLK